jgi:cyclohexanecarboxylate-CoA ligase
MIKKVQERHSCLKHIIVVSENQYEGTTNLYELLQQEYKSSEYKLQDIRPVGTDPFFIIFTSGTTGKPKAALHLHANNLFFIDKMIPNLNMAEDGKLLILPPIAHLTGLAAGVLSSLYRGNSIVLLSSWDVKKAAYLIENEKPSYLLGVTPMLIDLARYEELYATNFDSLKKIVYAGTACPANILNKYHEKFGCEIICILWKF